MKRQQKNNKSIRQEKFLQLSNLELVQGISIKTYKSLLQQLTAQNKNLIDFFQGNLIQSEDFDLPINQTTALRQYIQKLYPIQSMIKNSLYEATIKQLTCFLNVGISKMLQSLRQIGENQYEQILTLAKSANKKQRFSQQHFSTEFLVKLDVMSLFLYENHRINAAAQKIKARIDWIISINYLCRIFGLTLKAYERDNLSKKYQMAKDILQYENAYFQDIIALFYIVEVRIKLSNSVQRNGKAQFERMIHESPQISPIRLPTREHIDCQKQYILKYKFSQLALFQYHFRNVQGGAGTYGQQLIKECSKILQLSGRELKLKLLAIAASYKIDIASLLIFFQKYKNKQPFMNVQKHNKIISAIHKFQWRLFKVTPLQLLKGLRQMSGYQITENQFNNLNFYSHYIWIELYEIAMKRLRLFSNVLKAQKKIQRHFQQPLQIYVSKFQYSFIPHVESNSRKRQMQIFTVILATVDNHLLFCCISKYRISERKIYYYLKTVFKGYNFLSFNLNLYFLDYNLRFKTLDECSLIRYFKWNFDAHVFVITPCRQLAIHFLLDNLLKYPLKIMNKLENFTAEKYQQFIYNVIENINHKSLKEILQKIYDLSDLQNFQEKQYQQNIRQAYRTLIFLLSMEQQNTFYERITINFKQKCFLSYFKHFHFDYKYTSFKDPAVLLTEIELTSKFINLQNIENIVNQATEQNIKLFRYRNPELLGYDRSILQQDLSSILKQRGLGLKSFKQALREVVRNLFVCRVYFIQKMSEYQKRKEFKLLKQDVIDEIEYLNEIYAEQAQKIAELFSSEDQKSLFEQILPLHYFPSAYESLLHQECPKNTRRKQILLENSLLESSNSQFQVKRQEISQ